MQTSARRGISYPLLNRSDPADVPAHIANLVAALDVDVLYSQGTYANRPTSTSGTPGIEGRFYYVLSGTNAGNLYYDYGTGWITVNVQPLTPNSVTSVELADNAVDTAAIQANAVTQAKVAAGYMLMFPGQLVHWPYLYSEAPAGLERCDGTAVSRTTYPVVAAHAAASAYPDGNGDGSTTFNKPDYRGRLLLGLDNMGTGAAGRVTAASLNGGNAVTLGGTGGEETHVQTIAEMPSHNHPGSTVSAFFAAQPASLYSGTGGGGGYATGSVVVASQGGGGAHNNMPPWKACHILMVMG